ncbi:calcineurin-like phosphoesterase family protein [Luteibacter rhizovicinus]|uniref:Calcineurin-like phosphoesterase family protein n=1 Tax=Luteibacter rhizovicinus TaxID=242606 RepID=A0A4R3YP92_9GAMM|nr:metallophosphoesterase [Luteibacter rhizovicinus]TCV94092.1 calcineurin-like phosphoesterase family protein [Luteibacter rhizovicinus]
MNRKTLRRAVFGALALLGLVSAAHAQTLDEIPRTMIVTSDPQYPWTDKMDQGNSDESDSKKERRSEELIREQYNSIAGYRRARPGMNIPVVINGDLTAYGHGWQRSKMSSLYRILGDNYYLGLGNHDYDNNIRQSNGSGCANNGCARDSLDGLRDHVKSRNVLAFDFTDHTGAFGGEFDGSYAYAFEAKGFERVANIQLNNYPTYEVSFTTNKTFNYKFNVTSSLPWLHELMPRLNASTRDFDFMLIHVHQPEWDAGSGNAFTELVRANKVPVVFAGHLHGRMGRYYSRNFGNVPVFLSGSASQRTYLIVEHYPKAKVLRVYGVRNNDPENKQLIEEIQVPGQG